MNVKFTRLVCSRSISVARFTILRALVFEDFGVQGYETV